MSHCFRDRRILSAIRIAAAVLWIVSSVQAIGASSPEDPKEAAKQGVEERAAERAGTKTIRVIYDPETGEVVSVPVREPGILSEALARALTRSAEGLRVFELENGGKGVHLGGRYQHAYMVRIGPDGSLETYCTEHSHGSEKFLKSRSSGVTPEPRNK